MAKRIAFILSIMFFLFLCTTLKALAANLCVPDMSGNIGSIVDIPINVDDATGITGFQFCVTYNCPVIECAGVREGDLTSGWSIISGPGYGGSCQLCVSGYNPALTPLPSGNGSLVQLQCNVVGDPGTQTNMCLNTSVLSDELGNNIPETDCGCSVFTSDNSCDTQFSDVPAEHWAENYISELACVGIASGCGDNNYCPGNLVNRAQMAVYLVRAKEGNPPEGYCGDTDPFTDVPSTHWACGHIKRLSELGISTGYQDDTYKPTKAVNRDEMAVYIVRAVEGDPPAGYCQGVDPFTDVASTHWACGHIKRLSELKISKGYPDGTYKPPKSVNRAEMAVYVGRAFLGMP